MQNIITQKITNAWHTLLDILWLNESSWLISEYLNLYLINGHDLLSPKRNRYDVVRIELAISNIHLCRSYMGTCMPEAGIKDKDKYSETCL